MPQLGHILQVFSGFIFSLYVGEVPLKNSLFVMQVLRFHGSVVAD